MKTFGYDSIFLVTHSLLSNTKKFYIICHCHNSLVIVITHQQTLSFYENSWIDLTYDCISLTKLNLLHNPNNLLMTQARVVKCLLFKFIVKVLDVMFFFSKVLYVGYSKNVWSQLKLTVSDVTFLGKMVFSCYTVSSLTNQKNLYVTCICF